MDGLVDMSVFKEDISPTYEKFKARLEKVGEEEYVKDGYNNLWLRALVAPDETDEMLTLQMPARKIAEKIQDRTARVEFLQLCEEHTRAMAKVGKDLEQQKAYRVSDECNQRLWKIYTLGRANGLTNKDLLNG